MTVFRCFVEKKPAYAVESKSILNDLHVALRNQNVEAVRVLNRYDLENVDEEDYIAAKYTILSEPQVDFFYEEEAPTPDYDEYILATEYLPGQFDQRADSCAQCIQLSSMKQKPTVKTARLYYIKGKFTDEEKKLIEETLINPVEARIASLEKPETIIMSFETPELPPVIDGFIRLDEEGLKKFLKEHGLAMDLEDLKFMQEYFQKIECRNPTITEVRVIDTYWSDHCRHTTFHTVIDDVEIQPEYVKDTYLNYLDLRNHIYEGRTPKPVCLMDLGTIGAKALKKYGKLTDLDESEEINACSVKIKVDVDGEDQDWLLMFKNETHNHPTEIEPFGGAATCLGGAIRDPLSGRSYVYQAMRVTGAANPLKPINETMKGKLPQRKIVTTAAAGYSSYGNQIGLATGLVREIYHPGYVAKRMEVGAVIAAAPEENVVRLRPEPGDVVILLGGRTGRDGCGGATGSSKSHNIESLESCGAEVQKGNAPEERKLQRLFRNPEAAKLIKRCNDFGAGGVAVAIGELADGLVIDLNKVPKKYEGLNGTELAISESQERMAVVVRKEDAEKFQELASMENLETTIVAEVTEEPRMIMTLQGEEIVNISREFLNTNGASRHTSVVVGEDQPEEEVQVESLRAGMDKLVEDLNICSQKGLAERFDATIGSGTVCMPFGGKYQMTPSQVMAAKIPVLDGETDIASLMAYGYDPELSSLSPYKGAMTAVIEAMSKLVAAGINPKHAWLSFQEYFGRTGDNPEKWGKPFAALLGALKAQAELEVAAIGGKDSMSGTFEDIDVPPTLIAFAVSTAKASRIVTNEWKAKDHYIYAVMPEYDENGIANFNSVRDVFDKVYSLIKLGCVKSACALEHGGTAEALLKCSLGNRIGFALEEDVNINQLFKKCYGGFLLETDDEIEDLELLGKTIGEFELRTKDETISLDELQTRYEEKLESVYPCNIKQSEKEIKPVSVERRFDMHASYTVDTPHVLIPVFPGTNCEYDTARAFKREGAEAEIFVIKNLTAKDIEDSVERFVEAIHRSQIIALPGGFSGGDEPDGSAKFIVSFFRNPKVKEAVEDLLNHREGLMIGICNGFQALVKLGLVPYGKIMEPDEFRPTLTFNTIGRHQSKLVKTRVACNQSPWMKYMNVGDIHTVAISHGEGRFVAKDNVIQTLIDNGQIATQYVDFEEQPTSDIHFNPNDSVYAIEGITSPDGRILGKMGHSERNGDNLYKNVPDIEDQQLLFKAAVEYFTE